MKTVEKVEVLKGLLRARATGGVADDGEYTQLRRELLEDAEVRARLPQFVQTCRSLDEWWGLIKEKHASYQGRREYLRSEFDPLLTFLESRGDGVLDDRAEIALNRVDLDNVRAAWRKALDRRNSDPEGAITSARSLLETVCKHVLDSRGIAYDDRDDLPKLYRLVSKTLGLAPEDMAEDLFKRILGGCVSVVEGLGALRNRAGDAHGIGIAGAKPAPRHAELAVNLAGSMASFLVATWEARDTQAPPKSPGA